MSPEPMRARRAASEAASPEGSEAAAESAAAAAASAGVGAAPSDGRPAASLWRDDKRAPAAGRADASDLAAAGPDEGALARAAAAGDRVSFRALYELCGPSALRLAERIVRRRDLAEEAVQEGFCQAWARLAGFRGEARFRTWLLTIVRNASLDLLRRERTRERYRREEEVASRSRPRGLAPEEPLKARELSEALAQALAELPEETRTAFTLAAIERLGYAEIASVVGGTVDGVKCRVYRAREHLRWRLAAFREHDQ